MRFSLITHYRKPLYSSIQSEILNYHLYGKIPLGGRFGLPHEILAVGQVAADFATDHHRKLIDGELGGRAVVAPVVVVCTADRVELVRVLVLDYLLPDSLLDL